jgi:hypothetical protein
MISGLRDAGNRGVGEPEENLVMEELAELVDDYRSIHDSPPDRQDEAPSHSRMCAI